jgi:lipoate-protein ligase B
MAELTCLDIGRTAYEPALHLQRRFVDRVKATGGEMAYFLLVEHDPPVITLGRRGDVANVLASPEQLAACGIEMHKTGRGGDVTYHGPGQLAGYPILHLGRLRRSVGRFVHDLEEALIRTLDRFGIAAGRAEGLRGVWVGGEKIAALGVAISRHVSYHGIALNVCPDLSHFDLIVPCGIHGKRATSMAERLARPVSVDEVKCVLAESMARVFGFEICTMEKAPAQNAAI